MSWVHCTNHTKQTHFDDKQHGFRVVKKVVHIVTNVDISNIFSDFKKSTRHYTREYN